MRIDSTAASQRVLILLGRVGDRVLVLDDLRVLRAVPLVELHASALQIGEPLRRLCTAGLVVTAGIDSASAADGSDLDLVVDRFLLNPLGARPRVLVVHRVEARDDRVLPILERQRVVRLAILRHRALAVFDLRLLLLDLVGEELAGSSRVASVRRSKFCFTYSSTSVSAACAANAGSAD